MEAVIKKIVVEVLKEMDSQKEEKLWIPVEASAKHIHLSQEHVEALFGQGHTLTFDRELSQPGQFLAKERVMLVGPKGSLNRVAVLGPARKTTQVELSRNDSRALGVDPPLRDSGELEGTKGLVIVSGQKAITLEKGAMIAKRHIHMTPKDAEAFGVKDGDLVKVKIHSNRPVIFEDVLIRVRENYALAMHIDFDEANGCDLGQNVKGELIW